MNDKNYLLDIAGLILCIIMISVVAFLINLGVKELDRYTESQNVSGLEYNQSVTNSY